MENVSLYLFICPKAWVHLRIHVFLTIFFNSKNQHLRIDHKNMKMLTKIDEINGSHIDFLYLRISFGFAILRILTNDLMFEIMSIVERNQNTSG